MSMDSGATAVDSGSPMSFSLTVQGKQFLKETKLLDH